MRKVVTTVSVIAACFAPGGPIGATTMGDTDGPRTSALADGGRTSANCERRVDGVMREIYFRENVSCRKAKRIMRRYILRRELPGYWECSNLASHGKCNNGEDPRVVGGFKRGSFLAYQPGQRAPKHSS